MAKKLYAIVNGNDNFTGIVDDWSIAEPLVKGAKGVLYKSFSTLAAAQAFVDANEVKEEIIMGKKINVNTEDLNECQKVAVEAFVQFMGSNELCMSLSGYAGTGKTFTLGRISEAMKVARIPVAFIAPTNKAVVVMGKNDIEASTVHKFVYKYEVDNGRYVKTRRDGKEFNHGLIVMDESSMANDEILSDLEEYAQRAMCKILYVGDPGQLPPVGDNNKRKVFEEFAFKAQLTQVMRQKNGSRILDLATAIRNSNLTVPAVSDKDIAIVKSEMAFDNYVQKLREGKDATFVVFKNSTRVSTNLKVRAALGINGKPQNGEKFIAINNTESFANGEEFTELGTYVGEITVDGQKGYVYEAPSNQQSLFDDVPSDDGKKLIVVLPTFAGASFSMPKTTSGECGYIFEQCSGRYGDYCTIRRGYEVVMATYAYAITGHKSQGSQWDYVFVEEVSSREAVKWFYTVVTRAAKGLVLSKSIKYGARSWSQIEKAAYGEEVVAAPAVETTPVTPVIEETKQFASVPKKWTVKYFDNYEMF